MAETSRIRRPLMSDAMLDFYLSIWAQWMDHSRQEGRYPKRSCGFTGFRNSQDLESIEAQTHMWVARLVHKHVGDLPMPQQKAVYTEYFGEKWLLLPFDQGVMFRAAREEIRRLLTIDAVCRE